MSGEGAILTALVASAGLKYFALSRARAARERFFQLTMDDTIKKSGKHVNLKNDSRLTLVTSTMDGDWLVVSAPDMTPLRLPRQPDPTKCRHVTVNMVHSDIVTLDVGDEAADWMSCLVGQPVRVLYSGPGIGDRDAHDRVFAWPNSSRWGDKAVFAYLTSYLLTTTASLADLNSRLDSPVTSRHFRPNIEVDNDIAFDEDNWEEIRIGPTARFHYVQPCLRYRKKTLYGANPIFGAYVAIDSDGPIKVGDPVYAIKRQSAAS